MFSAFVEAEAWQVGAYTPGGNYLAYNEHHILSITKNYDHHLTLTQNHGNRLVLYYESQYDTYL